MTLTTLRCFLSCSLYFLLVLFTAVPYCAGFQNGQIYIDLDKTPDRVVTLNQSATEVMLAFGLQEKMVGTAFLDDTILPQFASSYNQIPVLSAKYPSKEVLFDVNPDFIYAGYASAFSPKRGLADRLELEKLAIGSYLSPSEIVDSDSRWKIDLLYQELREIGAIFRVEEQAEGMITEMAMSLEGLAINKDLNIKPRILWLDSLDRDAPYIGAGYGAPNEIIRLAGGENVFAELPKGWASVSKEQILDLEIDFVVLIDAIWDSAQTKLEILKDDPLYKTLEPIRKGRFVVIKFSSSTPGIRIPSAALKLNNALNSIYKATP